MANLDEFKSAADERTGLVPMRVNRDLPPYAEGQIAGFPPQLAMEYEATGDASRYTGGDDGGNVTGPRAGSHADSTLYGAGTPVLGAAPRLSQYERRPENSPRSQSVPSAHPGDGTPVEPAQLPEGWRDFPANRLRGLAADLSGRPMVELTVEQAVKLIELAEGGMRVGRGDFLPDDPAGKAHMAGGDEAIAAGAREAIDARTDQPEVETRSSRRRRQNEE